MTLRIVLAACLALVLALAVRWMMPSDRSASVPVSVPDTRFDYTLGDFEARFRNGANQLELIVSGPRLEHLSEERIAVVDQPRFHVEPQAADWRGNALRGRVLRDDELLILEGDIELRHRDPGGEIRVRAEQLRYDRTARTITSDQPVEVRQGESWLRSGGLTIRLDDNILELSDDVQAELQPALADDPDPAGAARSDGRDAGSGAGRRTADRRRRR